MVVKTTNFYAPSSNFKSGKVFLTEDETHHLVNVIRARDGDEFFVTDGEGGMFKCRLEKSFNGGAIAKVLEKVETIPKPSIEITLGVGYIHSRKMESVIDFAVQMGITGFAPIVCNFSQVKPNEEKHFRFEKIAIGAMKQSKRSLLPKIFLPMDIHKFLQKYGASFDGIVWADPDGVPSPPKRMIQPQTKLLALVGPEGGFSAVERQTFAQYDAVPISLGPARLKTETASVLLLAKLFIWTQDI